MHSDWRVVAGSSYGILENSRVLEPFVVSHWVSPLAVLYVIQDSRSEKGESLLSWAKCLMGGTGGWRMAASGCLQR